MSKREEDHREPGIGQLVVYELPGVTIRLKQHRRLPNQDACLGIEIEPEHGLPAYTTVFSDIGRLIGEKILDLCDIIDRDDELADVEELPLGPMH